MGTGRQPVRLVNCTHFFAWTHKLQPNPLSTPYLSWIGIQTRQPVALPYTTFFLLLFMDEQGTRFPCIFSKEEYYAYI